MERPHGLLDTLVICTMSVDKLRGTSAGLHLCVFLAGGKVYADAQGPSPAIAFRRKNVGSSRDFGEAFRSVFCGEGKEMPCYR